MALACRACPKTWFAVYSTVQRNVFDVANDESCTAVYAGQNPEPRRLFKDIFLLPNKKDMGSIVQIFELFGDYSVIHISLLYKFLSDSKNRDIFTFSVRSPLLNSFFDLNSNR